MTTYFVSRHPGALQWAALQEVHFDVHMIHLDNLALFKAGDVVIGTLPINMAYALNQRHVRYFHLSLEIPEQLRGVELNATQLQRCNASLEEFYIRKMEESHL